MKISSLIVAICITIVGTGGWMPVQAESPINIKERAMREVRERLDPLQNRKPENMLERKRAEHRKKLRKMQTRDFTRIEKKNGHTVITGGVHNMGDVHESGRNADAVGAGVHVKGNNAVYGRVTLMQSGKVSAEGSESATAAGTRARFEGRSVNTTVKSIVRGDVSATATNRNNSRARAAGTEVSSTGGPMSDVTVKNQSSAAVRALAGGR